MNKNKMMKMLVTAGFGITSAGAAFAASALDNETLAGLPGIGEDIGNFLVKLAPGVGTFIIVMGVFGGVAGIVYAIVSVIKNKIHV